MDSHVVLKKALDLLVDSAFGFKKIVMFFYITSCVFLKKASSFVDVANLVCPVITRLQKTTKRKP